LTDTKIRTIERNEIVNKRNYFYHMTTISENDIGKTWAEIGFIIIFKED
jgi:hypothetical protein